MSPTIIAVIVSSSMVNHMSPTIIAVIVSSSIVESRDLYLVVKLFIHLLTDVEGIDLSAI